MQYNVRGFSEIDKYAIKSYCAIHGIDESKNFGDITQIDKESLPNCDFICGGSPCQDFSIAGAMLGAKYTCKQCGSVYDPFEVNVEQREKCTICGSTDIEHTRSSLVVQLLDVVRIKKPKLFIFENVKNLASKRYEKTLNCIITELETLGYIVKYNVLNANLFGVKQNRERIYLVAVRDDIYRDWEFPMIAVSNWETVHFIEKEVSLKYYLNENNLTKFKSGKGFENIENTMCAKGLQQVLCDKTYGTHRLRENVNCITAREDRGLSARVAEGTAIVEKYTDKHARLGAASFVTEKGNRYCVRKLTPKECFRCMGFTDLEFECINGVSDGQLYKQAGNSIVVNVLHAIYKELYRAMPEIFTDLQVLSFFSGIGAFESALDRFYTEMNKMQNT